MQEGTDHVRMNSLKWFLFLNCFHDIAQTKFQLSNYIVLICDWFHDFQISSDELADLDSTWGMSDSEDEQLVMSLQSATQRMKDLLFSLQKQNHSLLQLSPLLHSMSSSGGSHSGIYLLEEKLFWDMLFICSALFLYLLLDGDRARVVAIIYITPSC